MRQSSRTPSRNGVDQVFFSHMSVRARENFGGGHDVKGGRSDGRLGMEAAKIENSCMVSSSVRSNVRTYRVIAWVVFFKGLHRGSWSERHGLRSCLSFTFCVCQQTSRRDRAGFFSGLRGCRERGRLGVFVRDERETDKE